MKIPHPFPYQGSKRFLAKDIIKFIPKDVKRFYEPFAGSASITLSIAAMNYADNFIISDINNSLMQLWSVIINEPELISQQYEDIWFGQVGREMEYYNEIRDGFNKTGRPDMFLFLLVRCVKAAVRYNSQGEFNQSPDKRRNGTRPEKMRREIFGVSDLLKQKTECISGHYMDIIARANTRDVIYMDPPYQGVSNKRDSRYLGGLSFSDFVNSLEILNNRGMSYIVSYDGRTGTKQIGSILPYHLGLKHIELLAGRSAQSTLLGRTDQTYESLYISPALQDRLSFENKYEFNQEEMFL